MNFVGKNAVVYGAGVSGISAYELLRELGAQTVIYDDSPKQGRATSSKGVFEHADIIVLSPGVDGEKDFLLDARLENKLVISELELASMVCKAEQIAITGTNGKTTTTMLVDHIFKCAGRRSHALGNIGRAFSSVADRLDEDEIAVIEASSFQLEGCVKFSPDTAVILNIAPDHLDRHGSLEKYAAAKSKIFLAQGPQDYAVYNADDAVIASLVPQMVAKKIPFSLCGPVSGGAYISSEIVLFDGLPIVPTAELDMKGKELENVLAAVAVAMTHGVSAYTLASALTSFSRPQFRRQYKGSIYGVKVYNDSKATNVASTLSAANSLDGDTVLMLGGAKRSEDFGQLFEGLPSSVRAATVCGENADDILAASKGRSDIEIVRAATLNDALQEALRLARQLGCSNILFSPSSKSFDMYSGYEERGRRFDSLAAELGIC